MEWDAHIVCKASYADTISYLASKRCCSSQRCESCIAVSEAYPDGR